MSAERHRPVDLQMPGGSEFSFQPGMDAYTVTGPLSSLLDLFPRSDFPDCLLWINSYYQKRKTDIRITHVSGTLVTTHRRHPDKPVAVYYGPTDYNRIPQSTMFPRQENQLPIPVVKFMGALRLLSAHRNWPEDLDRRGLWIYETSEYGRYESGISTLILPGSLFTQEDMGIRPPGSALIPIGLGCANKQSKPLPPNVLKDMCPFVLHIHRVPPATQNPWP